MVIQLDAELEAALRESARKQGIEPEQLALRVLRERFIAPEAKVVPRNDWERRILSLGTDCGVSLSNEAVSSEGLYD
jgi:hypothetical protein